VDTSVLQGAGAVSGNLVTVQPFVLTTVPGGAVVRNSALNANASSGVVPGSGGVPGNSGGGPGNSLTINPSLLNAAAKDEAVRNGTANANPANAAVTESSGAAAASGSQAANAAAAESAARQTASRFSLGANGNGSGGSTGSLSNKASAGVELPRGTAAGGMAPPGIGIGAGAGGGDSSKAGAPTNPAHALGSASSPPLVGQSSPAAAPAFHGGAAVVQQGQATSQTGLAQVAEDGVSTKFVPAKRCSAAAQETDGTTTCVGLPSGRGR
jgi:hypothetical protein